MSSVIKKKSAFMPKAAKRTAKKPLETPPSTQDPTPPSLPVASLPVLTPPATQAESRDTETDKNSKTQDNDSTIRSSDSNIQNSDSTTRNSDSTIQNNTSTTRNSDSNIQNNDSQNDSTVLKKPDPLSLHSYSIANVLPKAAEEASFDPMSKVPNSAVVSDDDENANDEDNENDYGDNDIFKHPMTADTRRRSSVANLRRLSGITALRRPSSFSATPDPNEDSSAQAPVTIGIPVTKPMRKRKSSVSSLRRKSARTSIISIPQNSVPLREEQEEQEEREETVADGPSKQVPSSNPDGSEPGIIVGLDPVTNKFRKFRSSEAVAGHDDLPVAPEDLVTTITSVKQLPKSIKKEDEHLFASVSLETEHFSMYDLCKPSFKIGEVSEKFQMAEEAKVKIAQRRDERRQARVLARKRGISYEKALACIQYPDGEKEPTETPAGSAPLDLSNAAMNMQPPSVSSGVQLQLVNGAIAVDTDSQVVSRGTAFGADDRMVEIENPFENPVTSRTYSKSTHTDSWTTDDVIRLYNALSRWGTDFTFIAQLFPYRTRRQIKSKFILEEKNNPQLVELALRRKLPANFESFCGKVSKNYKIKSVEEFNKEMAEIRRSHEAHLEEINNERERAIKEDLETNRKREIQIRAGTKPGSRKDRIRELRKGEVVVGTIEDVKRSRESMENEAS